MARPLHPLLLMARPLVEDFFCGFHKGSRKKSYSLNGRAIKRVGGGVKGRAIKEI